MIKSIFVRNKEEILACGRHVHDGDRFCNEYGEYVVYESDEHGFRNPGYMGEAVCRHHCAGDSYTHGVCVPTDKGFVATIRFSIVPAMINLGVNGHGPLTGLATLKNMGRH